MLYGKYHSDWEEGEISTNCSICKAELSIVHIESSDEGDDYEHLISESVEVFINGKHELLEAKDAELTPAGKEKLKALLAQSEA